MVSGNDDEEVGVVDGRVKGLRERGYNDNQARDNGMKELDCVMDNLGVSHDTKDEEKKSAYNVMSHDQRQDDRIQNQVLWLHRLQHDCGCSLSLELRFLAHVRSHLPQYFSRKPAVYRQLVFIGRGYDAQRPAWGYRGSHFYRASKI